MLKTSRKERWSRQWGRGASRGPWILRVSAVQETPPAPAPGPDDRLPGAPRAALSAGKYATTSSELAHWAGVGEKRNQCWRVAVRFRYGRATGHASRTRGGATRAMGSRRVSGRPSSEAGSEGAT